MNAEKILDSLVGARAKPAGDELTERPPSFLDRALSAFGLGESRAAEGNRAGSADPPTGGIGAAFGDARGTLGSWVEQAKEAMGRNPTLTAGALAATAGLLLSGRGRGLLGGIAGVGGMGLIGALAYNAFRNSQERKAGPDTVEQLNPANASESDALLMSRVMVAAIAADGRIDAVERARVAGSLREAGLDRDGAGWLEKEFAKPATVEELAADARTPERAAQVYAAARIAIEPDTPMERDFLDRLAAALRLLPGMKREIDGEATGIKAAV